MELPTLREQTCIRKIAYFRSMMNKRDLLTPWQRGKLREEMQAFCDSLSPGNVIAGGAGIGLGAAVLPIVGAITGPVIGGIYGAYKAQKLAHYRQEVEHLLEELSD